MTLAAIRIGTQLTYCCKGSESIYFLSMIVDLKKGGLMLILLGKKEKSISLSSPQLGYLGYLCIVPLNTRLSPLDSAEQNTHKACHVFADMGNRIDVRESEAASQSSA